MFEKEIKFITDFNLNRIKNSGAYLTLDNLSSLNLHPAIIQYITAELDYLIYLDHQRLLQKSTFDYSGEKISNLFTLIAEEIKKTKLIPYEDVKNLVENAVMFNINFILRPNWTLLKFIYDNETSRSADELKLFLNYIYYYDYYKKILLSLIEKKNLININIELFKNWLNKIQTELIISQVNNLIDNGLYTISEFINIGEIYKDKLNIGTVQIFLKENNLEDYIFKLRKNLSIDPKQKFNIEEIRNALYSKTKTENIEEQIRFKDNNNIVIDDSLGNEKENLSKEIEKNKEDIVENVSGIIIEHSRQFDMGESETQTESTTDQIEIEKKIEEEQKENNIEDEKTIDEITTNNELEITNELYEDNSEKSSSSKKLVEEDFESILNKELHKSDISEEEKKEEEKNDIEKEKSELKEETISQEISLNDSLEGQSDKESTKEEKSDSSKTEELFNLFTSRETMRIISSIFNQDSVDFVNTMESISTCDNFEQANEILKSVFNSYRVTPFNNKEANLLQQKIQEYFSGETN